MLALKHINPFSDPEEFLRGKRSGRQSHNGKTCLFNSGKIVLSLTKKCLTSSSRSEKFIGEKTPKMGWGSGVFILHFMS